MNLDLHSEAGCVLWVDNDCERLVGHCYLCLLSAEGAFVGEPQTSGSLVSSIEGIQF